MGATDNSIFFAAIPEPYQILGLRLKPFSLGHYLILRRHECAFVADTLEEATREDLIFAVVVCSMSFEEFYAWLEEDRVSLREKLFALVEFCAGPARLIELLCAWRGRRSQYEMMRWGRRVGIFELEDKVALFRRYLEEHSVVPKYWVEREDISGSGADWAQCVLLTLMGELHFTRDRALSMPLREALLHYYKHAEAAGAVRLMRPDEIEMSEQMEQEASCGA